MYRGVSLNNTHVKDSKPKSKKSRPPPVRHGKSHKVVSNVSHANVSLNDSPVPIKKIKKGTRRVSHNNIEKNKTREEIARRVEERRLEQIVSMPKIDKETKTKTIKERKMANKEQMDKVDKFEKSDKKMLEEGVINFFHGKKEFRSLSNFWENDVTVDGRTYESGEHCFHGEKYIRLSEVSDSERKKQLMEYGQTFMKPSLYKTGAMVKKMGGKKGLLLNPNELKLWTTISVDVQHKICKWKIDHYEEVRQDLLKSDGKLLVHPAMRCSEEKLGSRIWEGKGVVRDGKVVVLGKNLLGNIWMSFR